MDLPSPGCIYGNPFHEPPKLKEPMPWIGMYVAAASLVCFFAIAADAFIAFRSKKLWFPCKFFTLNAASLTLLGVAMKMPLDLSTFMAGSIDQLAKLSSTAMMTIVIGNFMPSLGPMDDKDIFMNITALGILVITVVVNICIQFGTGALRGLGAEHIVIMFFMLVLFVILTFTALTVATTKKHLELKHAEIRKTASSEELEQPAGRLTKVEKLREFIKKYWMMAETGRPQFVMARSVTCSVSGVICFLTALTLAEAELRMFRLYWSYFRLFHVTIGDLTRGYVSSDYKWSTFFIVLVQTAVVGVGVIGPTFRSFTAIKFRCSKRRGEGYITQLKPESYWIERLLEWKGRKTLLLRKRSPKCRKLVQGTKDLFLEVCIKIQIVIVVASKLILLICIFLIGPLISCHHYCSKLWRKHVYKSSASASNNDTTSTPPINMDHGHYVLLLEGEEELPETTLKDFSDAADRLILMGKKQQPKNLMELLQKYTGFKGVSEFDSDQIPSLYSQEPPNCWALPLVTLTSIALAIPKTQKNIVDQLVRSVHEGLKYVSHVDKSMDAKRNPANIRNAADELWLGVELYQKWLDEDLRKMALKRQSSRETLEILADLAMNIVMEFKRNMNGVLGDDVTNWPIKVIAANSMYRISKTILLDYEGINDQTDDNLFEKLCGMIASILGACLANLPAFVTMKCFSSPIEKRQKSVRLAAQLLGETEEILKILQNHELPCLIEDQIASIDEWRAKIKQENPLAFHPSSNKEEAASSGSGELPVDAESET